MPPGPLFPPGIHEKFIDLILIFFVIIGFLWIYKLFTRSAENISTKGATSKDTASLEKAIEEMTKEIRELRKDIKELKEELKE